jgi:hypothetical protein
VTRTAAWGLEPGVSYPYRIEGQRVSFCVASDPPNQGVSYWARVVSTGTYTAEPAVVQSMQSSQSIGFTKPDRVVIH